MNYRVAVASSDGKFVNQHFGRSKQYLIFEIEEKGYRFIEVRENHPPCTWNEHSIDAMKRTIDLLCDCRIVIVSQIGPGAESKLKEKRIKALVKPNFIDEVIHDLYSNSIQYGR